MKKLKIKLEDWSEAELDLVSAKATIGMLSELLFIEENSSASEVAWGVERTINRALKRMEDGFER